MMKIDDVTGIVVDKCIKIHSRIGPGCFEKIYQQILAHELAKDGLKIKSQHLLPLVYDDFIMENAYKLDMLVEDKLIIELKILNPLPPFAFDQIKSYLALAKLKHGMLINFKESRMKNGIHRVFNNYGREEL